MAQPVEFFNRPLDLQGYGNELVERRIATHSESALKSTKNEIKRMESQSRTEAG